MQLIQLEKIYAISHSEFYGVVGTLSDEKWSMYVA